MKLDQELTLPLIDSFRAAIERDEDITRLERAREPRRLDDEWMNLNAYR